MGTLAAVLTDGGFEREGCPVLEPPDARPWCLAGAREREHALVTFS